MGFTTTRRLSGFFTSIDIVDWYNPGRSLSFTVGDEWKKVEIHLEKERNTHHVAVNGRVIYSSNRSGGDKFYVYDPQTRETKVLTPGPVLIDKSPVTWLLDGAWKGGGLVLLSKISVEGPRERWIVDPRNWTLGRVAEPEGVYSSYEHMTSDGRLLVLEKLNPGVIGDFGKLRIMEITPMAARRELWNGSGTGYDFQGPDHKGNFYLFEYSFYQDIQRHLPLRLFYFTPQDGKVIPVPGWGVHNLGDVIYFDQNVEFITGQSSLISGYHDIEMGTSKIIGSRFMVITEGSVVKYPGGLDEPAYPILLDGAVLSSDGKVLTAKNLQHEWCTWSMDNLREPLGAADEPLRSSKPNHWWSLPLADEFLSPTQWVGTVKDGDSTDVVLYSEGQEPVYLTGPNAVD